MSYPVHRQVFLVVVDILNCPFCINLKEPDKKKIVLIEFGHSLFSSSDRVWSQFVQQFLSFLRNLVLLFQ